MIAEILAHVLPSGITVSEFLIISLAQSPMDPALRRVFG
jgi:hypothetical protein